MYSIGGRYSRRYHTMHVILVWSGFLARNHWKILKKLFFWSWCNSLSNQVAPIKLMFVKNHQCSGFKCWCSCKTHVIINGAASWIFLGAGLEHTQSQLASFGSLGACPPGGAGLHFSARVLLAGVRILAFASGDVFFFSDKLYRFTSFIRIYQDLYKDLLYCFPGVFQLLSKDYFLPSRPLSSDPSFWCLSLAFGLWSLHLGPQKIRWFLSICPGWYLFSKPKNMIGLKHITLIFVQPYLTGVFIYHFMRERGVWAI